jgi:hypothetical protein
MAYISGSPTYVQASNGRGVLMSSGHFLNNELSVAYALCDPAYALLYIGVKCPPSSPGDNIVLAGNDYLYVPVYPVPIRKLRRERSLEGLVLQDEQEDEAREAALLQEVLNFTCEIEQEQQQQASTVPQQSSSAPLPEIECCSQDFLPIKFNDGLLFGEKEHLHRLQHQPQQQQQQQQERIVVITNDVTRGDKGRLRIFLHDDCVIDSVQKELVGVPLCERFELSNTKCEAAAQTQVSFSTGVVIPGLPAEVPAADDVQCNECNRGVQTTITFDPKLQFVCSSSDSEMQTE